MKNFALKLTPLFLILVSLLSLNNFCFAAGTTYYVDFETGSNTNSGLSPSLPLKHAPGDPKATSNAASIQLSSGDIVLFKGGVVYRGNIVLSRSGTYGSPIVYKGDGWETQKAIIEGADPYPSIWTRCASAIECGGNANYAKIYYASAPAGYADFLSALYENDNFMWYAQSPNPSDPFYHDEAGEYYDVPFQSSTIKQTQTSITDPRILTQSSSSFWNGAYVAVWVTGNTVDIKKVTGFNPSTDTLTHEILSSPPYTDRTGRYSLMNHVSLIDREGEYAHDSANAKIYLWPGNGVDPNSNQYSIYSRYTAFYSSNALSNIIIEGFEIKHFTMGIQLDNSSGSNIMVRNNSINTLRSHNKYAVHVQAANSLVENNRIVNANRAVGILSSASNITVINNYVEKASRQGIWFMGARNSQIVNNTVKNIKGSHSNGISIYSGSQNILVSGNKIVAVNSPITFENSSGMTFSNNIVTPGGQISDWSGSQGTIAFYNNVFVNSGFYRNSSATYILKNNILGGSAPSGSGITRSNNIFTRNGVALQSAEFIETNLDKLFVNPSVYDYRLKEGSPAIDAGVNVPTDNDIEGNRRPQGSAWDIGAYEFVLGNTSSIRPSPPSGLMAP